MVGLLQQQWRCWVTLEHRCVSNTDKCPIAQNLICFHYVTWHMESEIHVLIEHLLKFDIHVITLSSYTTQSVVLVIRQWCSTWGYVGYHIMTKLTNSKIDPTARKKKITWCDNKGSWLTVILLRSNGRINDGENYMAYTLQRSYSENRNALDVIIRGLD